MGCRVIYDESQSIACLYCSVSDVVFGPIIYGERSKGKTAEEVAYEFIEATKPMDPRSLGAEELLEDYAEWRKAKYP